LLKLLQDNSIHLKNNFQIAIIKGENKLK
jgi:hypothetical protein